MTETGKQYDSTLKAKRQASKLRLSRKLSRCLNCSGGRVCHKCLTGFYDAKADKPTKTSSPLYLSPNSCESATILRFKRARFMVRSFIGVNCGLDKQYRFRWFVLTESNEAIEAGKDFGSEFHRFVTWLRKVYCPDFQYQMVEHRQGDGTRRNWHVLSYGSDKLPVDAMRDYWQSHYLSTVTGMAEVKDIGKAVRYLAEYLGGKEKFVRSWCSQGWVFRGWVGWSRWYRDNWGHWPDKAFLSWISRQSKERQAQVLALYRSTKGVCKRG